MGNTNKRSTSRTSHPGAQWDEENVLRLIAEKKLAPKHIEKEIMNKSCSECPICFLDFTLLNTVHCCKQSICTDCVVQLKCIEGKAACPFCGNVEMQVSLIPSDPRTNNSNSENSTNKKEECPGDSDPPSSRSSESSRVSLSYTTPEQERKLRSFSQDLSTSVATKNDREELERQIREQRMHFDERDLAEAAIFNRGSYFNSSGPGRVSSRGRSTTTQRASRHRFNADGSIPAGHNMGPPGHNARFVTRALLQGGAISTENEQDGEGSSLSPSRMLANSIEGLLGSRAPLSGISSLEQLEDIMLMEAIRLSMQDAAPSEPASHSSRGATLSSTTANQNMTFNSQSDSNDLRLRIDSSGSDEDYLRESDLLSEEEEQMRIALELSLTSLRNETGSSESTASQQDQNQSSIALLAAPKESSERDVVCAPPDMVAFAEDGEAPSDCPLSADDVDVDVVGTQTNSSLGDEAPITKMPANDSEEVTSTTGLPC